VGDKKIVSGLRKEGDFFIPVDSFYSQSRSTEYFMTLEDCTLYTINHDNLKAVYRDYPEFNYHMRILAELNARFAEELLHVLRNYSAHDRYIWLLEHFPDFLGRIPTKHLTSYIGMTVQSFTKVKRELANASTHPTELR
jgi:CRP-like cAMP-binding protein